MMHCYKTKKSYIIKGVVTILGSINEVRFFVWFSLVKVPYLEVSQN